MSLRSQWCAMHSCIIVVLTHVSIGCMMVAVLGWCGCASNGQVVATDDVVIERAERAWERSAVDAFAVLSAAVNVRESGSLRRMRAEIAIELHAYELAVEDLERYLSVAPHDGDAHAMLGGALQDAGRPAAAMESYRRAMADGLDDGEVLGRIARLSRDMDAARLSLAAMRSLEAEKCQDNVYWWKRVELEIEMGMSKAALHSSERWLAHAPASEGPLWGKAYALSAMGRYDEAVAVLSQPGLPIAVHDGVRWTGARVACAAICGKWREVMQMTEVLTDSQVDTRMLRYRCVACLAMGDYQGYRATLKVLAARLDPAK